MAHFVVGLTGGIGSGKTAVSDRFAEKGIAVVDADIASRAVVEPGQPALDSIAEHFGAEVIQDDGGLNRAELRKRVFADEGERKWLERLLHPRINAWLTDQLNAATSAYAILVNPLLIETGQHTTFADRVLVIDVPVEVQIERTMARDDNPREQVEAIIAAQINREDRLSYADDVIRNDQGFEVLDAEVESLHQRYLKLAQERKA